MFIYFCVLLYDIHNKINTFLAYIRLYSATQYTRIKNTYMGASQKMGAMGRNALKYFNSKRYKN